METIAVIPARGGSKGFPRKNLAELAGVPMVAWSVKQAIESDAVDRVLVSTDDLEIADVARLYGADVVDRPAALATDDATSESALLHALEVIGAGGQNLIDFVVFLQATSPVRESSDIDAAIARVRKTGADSLFSCTRVEDYFMWEDSPRGYRSVNYDFRNRSRRQDITPRYLENGSIYIVSPQILRRDHNRLGGKIEIYEMPFWKSFQVDEEADLAICEYYMRTRLLGEKAFK